VFTLLLLAVALGAGMRAPGPLRSACVTAIVIAVPTLWLFAFLSGGNVGESETRGIYLLTFLTYGALYVVSWTKGRAVFLAGALLVFASWVAFEVSANHSSALFFPGVPTSSATSAFATTNPLNSGPDGAAAAITVGLGLAFLIAGFALDRRGLAGSATPFIAVGAIEAVAGAIALGARDSTLLAGFLAIAAGAVVGFVGGQGERRRATTWFGVLVVFGGCVAVISDIAPDEPAAVGGIAFGFALVLGALAWFLAPILGEPDDGDDGGMIHARHLPSRAPSGAPAEG
jgi:hypothetical protein